VVTRKKKKAPEQAHTLRVLLEETSLTLELFLRRPQALHQDSPSSFERLSILKEQIEAQLKKA
jgi:hypothetical protein